MTLQLPATVSTTQLGFPQHMYSQTSQSHVSDYNSLVDPKRPCAQSCVPTPSLRTTEAARDEPVKENRPLAELNCPWIPRYTRSIHVMCRVSFPEPTWSCGGGLKN